MKLSKIIIALGTALCTFGVGLAVFAVFSWVTGPAMNSSIGPVDLDSGCRGTEYSTRVLEYCEVARRPECYSGKLLLMKAKLTGDYHGIYFFGPGCETKRTAGSVTPMGSDEYDEVLRKSCPRHCPEGLDVLVLGRFESVTPSQETDLNWHTLPMHLELLRIGKASATR